MGEMDDPAYIQSLLDPNSSYSCYFCIGDPQEGPVERIGVVPPMLMAHSLVLRRALDIQKSEVKEKWDIPVSDVSSKAFKNVLRYAYGYNNIKNQSLPHSVELLALADRWVMKPLSQDVANHIASIITPVNVCLAMRDPICLRVKRVEEEIASLVKKNSQRVLTSPYLHLVCPAGMRYIVLLKSLRASDMDVWRAVMRWARTRVLKQNMMMNTPHMQSYLAPKLLVPCRKHIKLCSLNMIDLVEEVLGNHPDKQRTIEGIIKYHYIPVKPPRSLYVCTESKNAHHLKHEEFQVKVVHICDSWMSVVYVESSTLEITNGSDECLELYSVVCTSKQKLTHELVEDHELVDPINHALQLPTDFSYRVSCCVSVILLSNDEATTQSVIKEVNFESEVVYGHDFHMVLSDDERFQLQPKSAYRIVTKFSKPHPLWYENDIDYIVPGQSDEIELCCGPVNIERHLLGSHIKFVLYRKLHQD